MNNTFGLVINRLSVGFLFAVVYQIVVASATYLLSIPLSGNISDLFLGIKKADSEGILLIAWWIISTIIITLISLIIVKHKNYFSVYKNEKNIDIPPKISILTIIVIGSIISFMFFLMDSAIGIFVPSNSAADVQAIYESALDGNFIPFYFSVLFSLLTGFIIVGVAAKTSNVSKITGDFGVNNFSYLSKFLTKKKLNRITMTDTIGFRPGALIHIGEKKVENIRIDLFEYDEKNVLEIQNATIEACLESKNKQNVTWINIIGIHDPKIIEQFGNAFGVHSLHQSNIMNTELRPSIDIHENYIFLMLKMPHFNEQSGKIDLEQISFVISKYHLLTFQEIEADFFDQIRKRLRENIGKIRTLQTDYLGYVLLDAIIDSYFLVLEKISDISENLEDELMTNPSTNTLHTLQFLKRQMILLRKSVWPAREVLDNLQRSSTSLIYDETKTYLRDVYNHAVQVIDTTEGLRDVVGSLLDTYLSSVSNKMNEVMKTLTVIASIFIPITFIASIYGTNFEYIPELQWYGSYFVMIAGMGVTVLIMLIWFKKKKWVFTK
ncbi:magnesium/cobalt transporter CorA [Nitrosarchaeum sp.]|uniref:magnesium/cobalt transporter CorA n=1 Tax=Nitrosarchaeum sp. TaxID=2026886 RepID=UPI00247C0648|nr:magnesium/cobalt transporter CorA [Nitrosarchaeum sp.]MCV0411709.1 magnesium/cobalt transporter CorA [Nitrosarchaeum sp.]